MYVMLAPSSTPSPRQVVKVFASHLLLIRTNVPKFQSPQIQVNYILRLTASMEQGDSGLLKFCQQIIHFAQ